MREPTPSDAGGGESPDRFTLNGLKEGGFPGVEPEREVRVRAVLRGPCVDGRSERGSALDAFENRGGENELPGGFFVPLKSEGGVSRGRVRYHVELATDVDSNDSAAELSFNARDVRYES